MLKIWRGETAFYSQTYLPASWQAVGETVKGPALADEADMINKNYKSYQIISA